MSTHEPGPATPGPPPPAPARCRACGWPVAPYAPVCGTCGRAPWEIGAYCQVCGAPTHALAVVCTTCGSKLGALGAKSKLVAGLLGIFVGGFGVHRFYLGYTSIGVIQIVVTIVTCGLGAIWGFVEGILILVGNMRTDAQGRPLTD